MGCIAVYGSPQWNVLDDLRDKPPLSCCPFAPPIIFSNMDHKFKTIFIIRGKFKACCPFASPNIFSYSDHD